MLLQYSACVLEHSPLFTEQIFYLEGKTEHHFRVVANRV